MMCGSHELQAKDDEIASLQARLADLQAQVDRVSGKPRAAPAAPADAHADAHAAPVTNADEQFIEDWMLAGVDISAAKQH